MAKKKEAGSGMPATVDESTVQARDAFEPPQAAMPEADALPVPDPDVYDSDDDADWVGKRYVCVRECRFLNRPWKPGEHLVVTSPTAIPDHFELVASRS